MANRLLDDGRTEDVERMLTPLLADTPAASDTCGAYIRALLARIRVQDHEPDAALTLLAPWSNFSAAQVLPPRPRAEVLCWRGHALADPDGAQFSAYEALSLLSEAHRLFATTCCPKGLEHVRQGRTAAYQALERPDLVKPPNEPRTVDADDPVERVLFQHSTSLRLAQAELRRGLADTHPLLITGARGTRKDLIARQAHTLSPRCSGPFLFLDARHFRPKLLDRLLFGFEEEEEEADSGRFHPGHLQQANEGTLFLNAPSACSRATQKKLLAFIETGQFHPANSSRTVEADVRLVVTSRVPLPELVIAGELDERLAHRLQAFNLTVDPLRMHRLDIPLLAEDLLRAFTRNSHLTAALTVDATSTLTQYDWPGNLQQLQNEIEQALSLVRSEPAPVIDRAHLSEQIRAIPDPVVQILPGRDLDHVLADAERSVIVQVLEAEHGNVRAAAEVLGLTRQGLYKKLHRLDLDPSDYQPAREKQIPV